MPLINCKVKLSLRWIENFVLTTAPIDADANVTGADSATFKITDFISRRQRKIIKILR